jgi:hypothetical protein
LPEVRVKDRQRTRHQACSPKQARINRAKAAEQAQALRPDIERCIEAGRTSSSAIAADLNHVRRHPGAEWWSMVSDAG